MNFISHAVSRALGIVALALLCAAGITANESVHAAAAYNSVYADAAAVTTACNSDVTCGLLHNIEVQSMTVSGVGADATYQWQASCPGTPSSDNVLYRPTGVVTGCFKLIGFSGGTVGVLGINSIALLQTLTSPASIKFANVSGYFLPGDQGGGLFSYTASTIATDHCTTFPAAGGGTWVRVNYEGIFSPRNCGAPGNGTDDDLQATQYAINLSGADNGVIVSMAPQIPWLFRPTVTSGNATGLVFASGSTLVGADCGGARLLTSVAPTCTRIKWAPDGTLSHYATVFDVFDAVNVRIANFVIDAKGLTATPTTIGAATPNDFVNEKYSILLRHHSDNAPVSSQITVQNITGLLVHMGLTAGTLAPIVGLQSCVTIGPTTPGATTNQVQCTTTTAIDVAPYTDFYTVGASIAVGGTTNNQYDSFNGQFLRTLASVSGSTIVLTCLSGATPTNCTGTPSVTSTTGGMIVINDQHQSDFVRIQNFVMETPFYIDPDTMVTSFDTTGECIRVAAGNAWQNGQIGLGGCFGYKYGINIVLDGGSLAFDSIANGAPNIAEQGPSAGTAYIRLQPTALGQVRFVRMQNENGGAFLSAFHDSSCQAKANNALSGNTVTDSKFGIGLIIVDGCAHDTFTNNWTSANQATAYQAQLDWSSSDATHFLQARVPGNPSIAPSSSQAIWKGSFVFDQYGHYTTTTAWIASAVVRFDIAVTSTTGFTSGTTKTCCLNIGGVQFNSVSTVANTVTLNVDPSDGGAATVLKNSTLMTLDDNGRPRTTMITADTANTTTYPVTPGSLVNWPAATQTASVTGSISGMTATITAVASGSLSPGMTLSGTGITAGTRILSQASGNAGSTGLYLVDTSQTASSTAITGTRPRPLYILNGPSSKPNILAGTASVVSTQEEAIGMSWPGTPWWNINYPLSHLIVIGGSSAGSDTVTNGSVLTNVVTSPVRTINVPSGATGPYVLPCSQYHREHVRLGASVTLQLDQVQVGEICTVVVEQVGGSFTPTFQQANTPYTLSWTTSAGTQPSTPAGTYSIWTFVVLDDENAVGAVQ